MANDDRRLVVEAIRMAMENFKGDDLERCERTFRHYTPEEMNLEFGMSGRTNQEVLDGYRQQRAVIDAAINALKRAGLYYS